MKLNKKLIRNLIIVPIVLIAIFILFSFIAGIRPSLTTNTLEKINLPDGFQIETFTDGLGSSIISTPGPSVGPRLMEFNKDNILFVSITQKGKIVALPDRNQDNKSDETVTFIENLNKPHGLAFYEDWIYIAEENKIIRVKDLNNDLKADMETLEVLIDDLPAGGHFTRTIKIFNNSLYISVGSSCNVCYEDDERRAAITKCDLSGSNCEVFAKGLRNAVGFIFHPITNEIYATDNGRDWLGDDLPPDEIDLVKEDTDYGWPLCYGKQIHDTDFDKNVYVRSPCEDTESSLVDLQAHSAPLGLTFYYGDNFPGKYNGDLFVAYHGSWNRGEPTGYKIVNINMDDFTIEDFATGWLQVGNVLGRPVDLIVAKDGSLLVSDDNAGKIYRIFYTS